MDWSRRIKRKIVFGILFIACIAGLILFNNRIHPRLAAFAIEEARKAAGSAMNDAIISVLQTQELNTSLFDTQLTGDGVYVIQANSARLNAFAAACAKAAQQKLDEISSRTISLPWGSITDLSILSGKGPAIQISFVPKGSVMPRCESHFSSAGINQTLHQITLILTADIQIILPGSIQTISAQTCWPIAESILVGKVPQAYTDVANEDDMLNLLPEAP